MYLEFYKLKEFPFSMGCDDRFFYESAIHAEALANMLYTFQQRKGMVLVTGEVGAGKTFVGNVLVSRLGPGCTCVPVKNPPQSGKQLLRAVARKIGIGLSPQADKQALAEELEQHLLRMHARGRMVAMIVDECQDLTAGPLEEIRLLWNLEQNGQRLIQILLIGQPELRQRLLEPKWESLRQRIVLSYHLGHLSLNDTCAYVAHRLKVASNGQECKASFAQEALEEVHSATDGIPRLVNVLCDNALLVGYARNTSSIDRSIIVDVLQNMTCWGLRSSSSPPRPASAAAAV